MKQKEINKLNIMEKIKTFFVYIVIFVLVGFGLYDLIIEKHWIILSLIVVGFILFIGFIILLVGSLDAGFRNKFPMDYLFQLGLEIKYFEEKGFSEKEYIDPGTDNPGVILKRDGKLIEIKLVAPLNANKFTTTIFSPNVKTISLEYNTSLEPSEKISKLKYFYQELDKAANSSSVDLNT